MRRRSFPDDFGDEQLVARRDESFARAERYREETSMSAAQKPSVGRIVHYTNLGDRDGKYPPQVIAAMVTKVNEDGSVALTTFYPTGTFNLGSVAFTESAAGSEDARGKWTWPARV